MPAAEALPTKNEHILKPVRREDLILSFKKDRVMSGMNARTKPREVDNWTKIKVETKYH